ncbi:MAG TPA: hypothetical protein VIM58_05840 [Candidatus Methylacidiphilales bacterium]
MSAPLSAITPTAPKSLDPVTAPALKEADMKKLHDTAVQTEATFTTYMLDEISKGFPGTANGKADEFSSDVFGGIFKQAIATKITEANGTHGVAQQIYEENVKKLARGEAQKQGIALPANALIALRALPVDGAGGATSWSPSRAF